MLDEALSNGNVVKFVDDLFNGLVRKHEFLRSLDGFADRYDLEGRSISYPISPNRKSQLRFCMRFFPGSLLKCARAHQ
jgi:hypothetical protein